MLITIQKGEYRFYKDTETHAEYISVTSCLSLLPKPGLIIWAVMQTVKYLSEHKNKLDNKVYSTAYGIHKQVLNGLANEGTEDHDEIEKYLRTGVVINDPSVKRFIEWEKESGFKYELIEQALSNDKLRSGGTADLIGNCSGVPMLVDLKTSKAIRLSHKIQAAVYKYMLGDRNRKAAVLLIPRDPKKKFQFYVLTEEEEQKYLKIYFLLVNLFYMLLELGEIDFNNK